MDLRDAHRDLAARRRELHRVGDEVEQDLVEAHLVAVDVFVRDVEHVHEEVELLGVDLRGDDGLDVVQHVREVDLGLLQADLAALDAAHVQDVVDEAQQVVARGEDLAQVVLDLLFVAGVGGGERGIADHRVHGRADIVAHVAEEGALGLVGRLSDAQGVLCRLLEPLELLVDLLLGLHLLPDAAHAQQAQRSQDQQHGEADKAGQEDGDGAAEHAHGVDRDGIRRNQQHERGLEGADVGERIEVLGAVDHHVCNGNALLLELLQDELEALALHVLRALERLVDVAHVEDVVLVILICEDAVRPDDEGGGRTAKRAGAVEGAHAGDVFHQGDIGDASACVPDPHWGFELADEGEEGALDGVGVADEGVALGTVGELLDVVPDADLALAGVEVALGVE